MRKRIYLLTGAAGLLGSNVSRQLIEQGEKVRALVLNGDTAIKYVPKEVEIVNGDLLNIASLEQLFDVPEDTDIIMIHSASVVTLNPNPNPKVHAVNVDGTQNIIDMCIKHKAKKLVYISSTGAIPEKPGNEPIKEVNYFDPNAVVGYYSVTKAEATQLVLDAVKKYPQLDASIVHPTGICGPNDYAFGPVSSFLIQYAKGEMSAGIEGTFNSVDVRDLADGVIACCEKGRRGECYIMGNCLVSMGDMFKIVNRAAGLNYKPKVLPVPVAKIVAKIMGFISKITGKPAMLTDFAIYNLARNNNFCYDKAVKELGYKVRPFEQTISDEIKWLKAEGKI
jgi:dihydroflavonol-4-reductase